MRKTHKNILGLSGLGLVVAVTTFAATLPAPTAGAVSSVTDTLQIMVVPTNPEVILTTDSANEITDPTYKFKLTYADLSHIEVELVNRDSEGNVIYSETLVDKDLNWETATEDFTLNLDDYGGHGYYTIKATGIGYNKVPIERYLTVTYKNEEHTDDGGDKEPGDDGDVDVDVDIPTAEVKTVVATLYNGAGESVWSNTLTDPKESETLTFTGLPNGVYTLETISRDGNGNMLQKIIRIIVINDGTGGTGGVDVPIEDQGETIGKVIVTLTNEGGTVLQKEERINPTAGETISINTDGLAAGVYTIKTEYFKNTTDSDAYKTVITTFIVTNTDKEITIPIEKEVDVVKTLEADIYSDATGEIVRKIVADRATGIAYVYDANGDLLYVIPGGYTENMGKGDLTLPMEGLESGDYTAIIMYKDKNGHLVGNTKTIHIRYDAGKAIIVPDTGSFFQGLNISREDYLITGAVVFAVIGVVAFGVVARNRNQKTKRSRR